MAERNLVSEYIRCPRCNSNLRVTDTDVTRDTRDPGQDHHHMIRRRRRCTNPDCKYRVTSYERFREVRREL